MEYCIVNDLSVHHLKFICLVVFNQNSLQLFSDDEGGATRHSHEISQ